MRPDHVLPAWTVLTVDARARRQLVKLRAIDPKAALEAAVAETGLPLDRPHRLAVWEGFYSAAPETPPRVEAGPRVDAPAA